MTSIAAVSSIQARIAEIRSMIQPQPTVVTVDEALGSSAVATTQASAGSDFASAYENALTSLDAGTVSAAPIATHLSDVVATSTASSGLSTLATQAVTAVGDATSASSGPTGQDLVEAARQYLGTPYVWGGESLSEGGLDCSGLVQLAFKDIGVTDIPRVAKDQGRIGTEVASLDEAKVGDLLIFDNGSHIGIYLGDGKMIDAPYRGSYVQERKVYETPTSIRRVL
ncbi:C40 family peptidase [Demequina subtropica]|uniref:C40 family peptidase n=1 Tax=Demequina subtropica TaxID=1638989 RepID=UPI0007836E29|nr:C40 family peptidase [Demequina subtropica]